MIKVPITYKDFDGNEVIENHHFHMSKAELIDLETSAGETLSEKLTRAGQSNDGAQIMKVFKDLVSLSYGQRVEGSGGQFYKDEDLTKRFMGSLAFDQLLVDLLTNVTNGIDFVNGLMPSGIHELAATMETRVAAGGIATSVTKANPEAKTGPITDNGPDLSAAIRTRTGLKNPMIPRSTTELLPWALREPTSEEVVTMNKAQLQDVFMRSGRGWVPTTNLTP